jgi:predicted nucleotidyltransferase
MEIRMEKYKNTGLNISLIEELKRCAKEYNVEKLYLFGSRARGDYKERSDIDLAFFGGDASRFILEVEEETATLLQYDIVDLALPVQEELMASIHKEGILLYEKV